MKRTPFNKLLVIASSARMLTQMAVNAGFMPIAVDCYADEDTRLLAVDMFKVVSLAVLDIHDAIDTVIKKHDLKYLIYGSGFEAEINSLKYLESRFVVLGNSSELFRRFQDKANFFGNLKLLGIHYPESVFCPPCDEGDWLVKPMQGQGGHGISRLDDAQVFDGGDIYWQRFQAGESFSALFVACHHQVRILGFNKQWSCQRQMQAFVFAGIRNHAVVSEKNRALLDRWLQNLVELYPLQGLGSLDFIVNDGICYLLEINPRIPASAQLYGQSVLNLHWQACMGQLPELNFSHKPSGYQIIVAEQSMVIPAGLAWPHWVVDRPGGGAFIGKGQPVCSIIAAENDADKVENQLRRQQIIIENFLKTGL